MCPRTMSIIPVMKTVWLTLIAACLVVGEVSTAMAHQVALKNGQVINFENYRVTEKLLLYTDKDGKEVSVALGDIDLDRTRQLSAGDRPALDLPGLVVSANPTTESTQNQSLGDIARKLRSTDAKPKAQRTLTDDDVAHGYDAGTAVSANSSRDQIEDTLEEAEKYAHDLQSKTPRQLGEITARDIEFPGRDAWESKLAAARDDLVKKTDTAAFTIRTEVKELSANDISNASEAKTVINGQLSDVQAARQKFEQILSDGASKAAEWEQATESSVANRTK